MARVRPTLRCLQDDLNLSIPPIDDLFDEIKHPLLSKASEQFAHSDTRHERIRAIDDQILFKVKIQRWRGAVWTEEDLPWLVAAGWRETGSADDFYAAPSAEGTVARARYNSGNTPPLASDTYSAHLLPGHDDRLRHRLEAAVRFTRDLEELIPGLVRDSLQDGREHVTELDAFILGIQVRAEHGHETYIALRIHGSVPKNLVQVVLDIVPGCAQSGWYPEAVLPGRFLGPHEQAWSNIMDTAAAAKLLEID